MSVFTLALHGTAAAVLEVECRMTNGLPTLVIVGSAKQTVIESRERLRSAFSASRLSLPPKRITINLAPADLPKDSPAYDVAMAVAIMEAQALIKTPSNRSMFFGELSLGGHIKPVRGLIGLLLAAQRRGFQTFYVPLGNLRQALMVPGLTIVATEHLREVYRDLSGQQQLLRQRSGQTAAPPPTKSFETDFRHIVGQTTAKRALAVAAVGHHNILLSGPPGTGKSMLAKALPSILPPLNNADVLQVSHLHSLTSLRFDELISRRPFRAPHHTIGVGTLLGSGNQPRPGEISLAHRGVLFLDELPEFKPEALEALRQPLEDHHITIARLQGSLTFPADFILVATANPCPCGYLGSDQKCTCLPFDLRKYQQRISGPLWDRIDLYVQVESIVHEHLLARGSEESSQVIAARVAQAREFQAKRGQPVENGLLSNQAIKRYAPLTAHNKQFLNAWAAQLQLSARAYMRVLKVARSVADLENSLNITEQHLMEALQYRQRGKS